MKIYKNYQEYMKNEPKDGEMFIFIQPENESPRYYVEVAGSRPVACFFNINDAKEYMHLMKPELKA